MNGTSPTPQEMLLLINEATAPLTGGEYFRSLVGRLARLLGVHAALVTECIEYPRNHVRTLAYWEGDDYVENFAFDLVGTPCEEVIEGGRFCFYPNGMTERFPQWSAGEGGVESFIGIPIYAPGSESTRVIGHIAIFNREAMNEDQVVESVFRIIAARAGAELQRVQAEAALRDSEEKYRLLVENQSDLIVNADAEGRLLFASPSYSTLFGVEGNDIPGVLFPPLEAIGEQEARTFWNELLSPPHETTLESRVPTPGGTRVLSWSARAVHVGSDWPCGSGFVATGRDITAQREAESRARRSLDELAHVSRLSSLGEMAAALAHEIRQPLTSITNYSNACLRILSSGDGGTAEVQAALSRVCANAERASEIVVNLQRWAKKGSTTRNVVDLNHVVCETVSLLAPEAEQYDIDLQLKLADDAPRVEVDSIQIQQVVFNLARNGFQAISEAGNGHRQLSITTGSDGNGMAQVLVSDTGAGIADDVIDRLFQPFVSTRREGMGIGLSISSSIAEDHGGRLSACNLTSGGAQFRFVLPAWKESANVR